MLVSSSKQEEKNFKSKYEKYMERSSSKYERGPRGKSARDFGEQKSCISSVASSSNVSGGTHSNLTQTSIFPHTASYVSSAYSTGTMEVPVRTETSSNLREQMERLNLLAKYNAVDVYARSKYVQEHGENFVIMHHDKDFIQFKPKLKMPIPVGKFARWFQVVDPNATIRDDIKMARGVLRKDRFQHPTQLDTYLGVKQAMERAALLAEGSNCNTSNKEQQYRVKRVRNKLKHWNAMYKQLHDAIASVDTSNYTMREKVQHVDQICSIYIGRADRAIECFYAEPAAHFMLDMVVSLQKKLADARAINQSYQSVLINPNTAIV